MSNKEALRLSKIARELNVGISTLVEFLHKKGVVLESNPNAKVPGEWYDVLTKEFGNEAHAKIESQKISLTKKLKDKKEPISIDDVRESDETDASYSEKAKFEKKEEIFRKPHTEQEKEFEIKVVGNIDLNAIGKSSAQGTAASLTSQEHQQESQQPEVHDSKPERTFDNSRRIENVKESAIENQDPTPSVADFDEGVVGGDDSNESTETEAREMGDLKVVGKIDLDLLNQKTRPAKKTRKQREDERRQKERAKFSTQPKPELVKPENLTPNSEESENAGSSDEPELFKLKIKKLSGPTVIGKIELPTEQPKKKPTLLLPSQQQANAANALGDKKKKKKKRKRIKDGLPQGPEGTAPATASPSGTKPELRLKSTLTLHPNTPAGAAGAAGAPKKTLGQIKLQKKVIKKVLKKEVNDEDVSKQIKETLARLEANRQKSKSSKHRRLKREQFSIKLAAEKEQQEHEKTILKVTEFVTVNELASMMKVSVNKVIELCMSIGLFVGINQRLDAETISLVGEEFGFTVEFISIELQETIEEEVDKPEDLVSRPPVVAVMGHVDHGKTSLLDYIRHTNVIAGEAGGITQHIGAYNVKLESGKRITFLDTPGHQAFTAMRARGAKVTDIAIIVVSADDNVMPTTIEAINHASAAGVPMVFAINKIDKPGANPEKIKQSLAEMNYLVEEWGGKYQSQDISAKKGLAIDLLLEKVLLEAEMLELKANPKRKAVGSVIESTLDKGRGYVTTVLVENGTLRVGDVMLAGNHTGKVRAMFNERNQRITSAAPGEPVIITGLNGAPQAGDKFNVMADEREAREIANKREQLLREQGMRTRKHITLDEIGRRIAIGNFKELNIIVKGDVDGSVEALSDSLIRLSTEQIQVNVIHKAVGPISESDIMLATASNAIIVGFQVRPQNSAKKLAESEGIDIRLYSIIYDAIDEIKDAMEGMLSPELKEEIVCTLEVREAFNITKVGTVAGCIVRDGKITRNTKIRVIRDGIVIHTGELGSLKRYKDDVKEVATGYECGLNIVKYNDILEGDVIEGFTTTEVRRKL